MENPSGKVGSDRRKRRVRLAALTMGAAVVIAALAWWTLPVLTEHLLERQLEQVEARIGMVVEAESVQTPGLDELQLRGVTVALPGADEPLGTIDELDASADLFQSLRGRPAVTGVRMRGVRLAVHRRADGSSDLDELWDAVQGDDEPAEDEEEDISRPDAPIDAAMERALSYFGGQYPQLQIDDVLVEFTHHPDSRPWPVRQISTDEIWMDGDASQAPFGVEFNIESPSDERWELPDYVEITGTMRRPAEHSTLAVDIEPALRIAEVPQLPFLELSIDGLSIPDQYTVEIAAPRVDNDLMGDDRQLASADRIQVQFSQWTRSLSGLTVIEIEADSPRLFVNYAGNGASNLSQLHAIWRQPAAGEAAARARAVGDAVAAQIDAEDEDQADDTSDGDADDDSAAGAGVLDRWIRRIADFPVEEFLTERLPHQTTLRDVRLVVDDRREHQHLTRPAHNFEITGEQLHLRHSPLQGLLEGDVQLQMTTDDDVGTADVQFEIPYRRGDWNATVDIDQIQLAHFSQLGGPRLARHVHGGQITAAVDIENDENATTHFDGLLAAREFRVHFESIADDSIEVPSASLHLGGFYDSNLAVPPFEIVELEEEESDDDGEEESDDDQAVQPPEKGAFVIDKAVARLDELEANVDFAIYGLDGGRRPNRTAIGVDLKPTELQTIIDAVPTAIRGPLDGLQLQGYLGWNFELEVPLYEASQMAWNAQVDLSEDLEVLYIPDEVDVFKLTEEFEHTIEDEWEKDIAFRERQFFYERTVTIPKMRPTPVQWLLENTSLELEEIDEIWREREWPPVPEWSRELDLEPEELEEPEYWLTSMAVADVADEPWEQDPARELGSWWDRWGDEEDEAIDGEDDEGIPARPVEELVFEEPEPPEFHETEFDVDPNRHGEYVYVPLHHISPYMIRAIMTTEDTSFFTHSGFNYLAIRQSVEANLEAGRYVRGASTISMQLAKNLFLDRDRVLSRKLQEVALVWLMESVAEIPKERLMELYLNIIEFGPGIYGIHEAAVYYFGKRPDELTIAEVAWLVSIVPNPKRYHKYYDRGEITPYWFRRMSRYIRAMHWRERISEEEMEEAIEDDPPAFYIPEDGEPFLSDRTSEGIDPDTAIETDGEDDTEEPELPIF